MRYPEKNPENTADYIAMAPVEYRKQLKALAALIRKTVPIATEAISYQIPCFKYHYMLVGIGINKKYCSFYTLSPGLMKLMKDELNGLRISGATIHLLPDEPLPESLIVKIIHARMKENELRKLQKK